MKMTESELRTLAEALLGTHDEEIGCDDALGGFGQRADEELDGVSPSDATRLVALHLEICPECEEEYRALLAALRVH